MMFCNSRNKINEEGTSTAGRSEGGHRHLEIVTIGLLSLELKSRLRLRRATNGAILSTFDSYSKSTILMMMQKIVASGPAAFLFVSLLTSTPDRLRVCLPAGVKRTDIVSAQWLKATNEVKRITVEEKLDEIKARCKKGKLVDATGKEVYFFRLTGCWGNPPVDYQETLRHQEEQLDKLKKRYTVIEMTCNPDGVPLH
jgi:hypothetical protein